ncbi:unnamed protein product [Cylicocyclus nassatus]|uniref:Uncharacterized protein n=1 Tax=Cylicocyclus nassatus TaxID=53992 RepID=A0AA36DTH8_CYLNA|nr:unnamed protein product [Cylicocyclus nassatus]
MKWFCFKFWFVYRLILACLSHFNWFLALYTNCIYFTLWKSYDLLWFWMHLTLCSCFQSLRCENYLVVWSNLIWQRYSKYPNKSYKQLYLALYGGKGTKAERALQRMDTIEIHEKEQHRLRPDSSSSSSEGENETDDYDAARMGRSTTCGPRVVSEVMAEEEAECRKYVYVGQAVESHADAAKRQREASNDDNAPPSPVRPPRPSKESSGSTNALNGEAKNMINVSMQNGGGAAQNRVTFKDTVPVRPPITRSDSDESKTSAWGRILQMIPNPLKKSNEDKSVADPAALDVLAPNFTNTYDVYDEKKLERRAKRDRKALTQKVRRRLREELREAAKRERKRKRIADSIELFLQLLRMIASFAVLVGNIRKTFIPAQFKYLRPGQHAYDHYELLLLFRVTTFIDVSMFWTNVMWVYCLQWHLCCRLGFMRFWMWLALLSVIATAVMIAPMSYAMNEMDLSWCRFMPNSTLAKYQPQWRR